MQLQQTIEQFPGDFTALVQWLREIGITVVLSNDLCLVWCNADVAEKLETLKPDEFGWLRECNGAIIEIETRKIVCRAEPHMYKRPLSSFNATDYRFQRLLDGTLLRLYWWNDAWRIATCRRPFANNNRWTSSETYAEMLEHCQGFSWEHLIPGLQYSYLLCHPSNRQISIHSVPVAYFLNVYTINEQWNVKAEMPPGSIIPEYLNVPQGATMEEFADLVYEMYKTTVPRGFVGWHKDSDQGFCYEFPAFVYARDFVRCNAPSLDIRYLELLSMPNYQLMQTFYNLFSDKLEHFQSIDVGIARLVEQIHTEYYHVYIQPRIQGKRGGHPADMVKFLSNPRHEQTLRQLDARYRSRDIDRVTPIVVFNHVLDHVPPPFLLKLIGIQG